MKHILRIAALLALAPLAGCTGGSSGGNTGGNAPAPAVAIVTVTPAATGTSTSVPTTPVVVPSIASASLTVPDVNRVVLQIVNEATARGTPAVIAVVDRVGNEKLTGKFHEFSNDIMGYKVKE